MPIEVNPYIYDGPTPTYLDIESLYSVCVSHPQSSTRRFVAEYFTQKWDNSVSTCLYSGNIQGGRLLEVSDPDFNDPVIEGEYTDYVVEGLFQNSYKYSRFSACNYP